MVQVKFLRGLPGSGKTHWALQFLAENPNWRRVNKDELRKMLWGSSKPKNNERHLDHIQELTIHALLDDGFSVIVDNTHLSPKREKRMRDILPAGVPMEVVFFDTPLFQCIINDAGRPNPVGHKVIGRMYEQFLKPPQLPFVNGLEHAYIVDLDGTTALHNGRSPYDYSKLNTDLPYERVCMTIGAIADTPHEIIFVSGRPEEYRDATVQWLNNVGYSGFSHPKLFMRATGDFRQDAIVKREIFDREIRGKYNIIGVFDDRQQVVEMWRSLGLTVFQVNYGFF